MKTADIGNKVISRAKIRNNAVSSVKVADGSLQLSDLSLAAQDALKGNAGPAGRAGAPGTTGPPGPAGTSVLWAVVNSNGTLARGTTGVSSAAPVASSYKGRLPS